MGFWAATAKSSTSNMKINRPPVSWSGEAVCQPVIREDPLIHTQALQGALAGARGGDLRGHGEKTEICESPIIMCVLVYVGDQRACDLNS